MRVRLMFFATLFVALTSVGAPAHACITRAAIELADIKYADVVVEGRISNYTIVLDPIARQKLANSPDISPQLRESLDNERGFISDYARFDVLIDEVLVGKAPQNLTVTWDNSTFGEPEGMPSGPFLIALRDPRSAALPLRGPSATILPNPEPGYLTVLQTPCSDPFIFPSTSDEARAILKILRH